MLRDEILGLNGRTALQILQIFARTRLRHGNYETEFTPVVEKTLQETFEVSISQMPHPTEGDLAREALLVLAEHPQHGPAIEALVRGPRPEALALVETAALVAAVLVVLQTHVKFERDKQGQLSITIEKKPTRDSLLRPLVQQLIGFVGGGKSASR